MSRPVYRIHSTPLGDALLVLTGTGLAVLDVLDGPGGDALAAAARRLGEIPDRDEAATADVAAQLDGYFAGERRAFDVPLDWVDAGGFARDALEAITTIPYGQTASYGEIAIIAGSPRAHRAVGSACARAPMSIVVPVHRVVRSDGSLSQYGGHPERKRWLLDLETRVVAEGAGV